MVNFKIGLQMLMLLAYIFDTETKIMWFYYLTRNNIKLFLKICTENKNSEK